MSRLTEDSARLVRSEIQLAKAEVTSQVASFARVAVFGVIAGAIAVLSLFALMLAGIFGLATQFSLWLSALIVFGVMILIAGDLRDARDARRQEVQGACPARGDQGSTSGRGRSTRGTGTAVSTTDEARRQVEEARQRLVGTVGEIGTAIDDTKAEVQAEGQEGRTDRRRGCRRVRPAQGAAASASPPSLTSSGSSSTRSRLP